MSRVYIPCAAPLQWPMSKPRTRLFDKRSGNYSSKGSSHYARPVTMAEARTRVLEQIGAFSGGNTFSVIDPWECELTTNMEVNLDGSMRARQRKPEDTGAALMFPWKGRETVIAIDCFYELEQNIAGIAAALESLRRLHRLDGGILDQAMSGFNALPAPIAIPTWRSVLGYRADATPTFDEVKRRYRIMASKAHPDKGGQPGVAADVNRAWGDAKLELAPVYSHS